MTRIVDIISNIISNILTALYQPFWFAILLSIFLLFFYLYCYDSAGAGKGWKEAVKAWIRNFREDSFFRKLFLLVFFTAMVLFRTLLNRNDYSGAL